MFDFQLRILYFYKHIALYIQWQSDSVKRIDKLFLFFNQKILYKYIYTVKPVLRGHLWDKEKVALWNRWPLKRGSIHMKFSMTGQERVAFKYRWLNNRGDHMGMFDCISYFKEIDDHPAIYFISIICENWLLWLISPNTVFITGTIKIARQNKVSFIP